MTSRTLVPALLSLLTLTACPGIKDDTGSVDTDDDTDTDTDTDSDTDTDTDTDTDDDTDTDTDTDSGGADTGIFAIQRGQVAVGEVSTLEDVVVTSPNTGYGFFVQEVAGGEYSGLWVYYGDIESGAEGALAEVSQGDLITVTGTVAEYGSDGVGTLTELNVTDVSSLIVSGTGTLPDPIVVDAADLIDADAAEPYESCLVQIVDATVAEPDADHGEWTVNDGAHVDDMFYDTVSEYGALYVGDTFTSVTGPLYYSYENFKIEPRDAGDLLGYFSEGAVCAADLCVEDLSFGDLVISELMTNPNACADPNGEYVELYNATSGSVDLAGLMFVDNTGTYTIDDSVIVEAGGYVWLANATDSDAQCYLGYGDPDYYYSTSLALANDSETVEIDGGTRDAPVMVDSFEYPNDATTKGVGYGLNPTMMDATSNDDAASWCLQTTALGSTGDLGTPGDPNDSCGG